MASVVPVKLKKVRNGLGEESMTIENRSVFDFTDIVSIQFECQNPSCSVRVSYQPDQDNNPPENCPRCNSVWTVSGGADRRILVQLLNAIRDLRQGQVKNLRVRLEFPAGK